MTVTVCYCVCVLDNDPETLCWKYLFLLWFTSVVCRPVISFHNINGPVVVTFTLLCHRNAAHFIFIVCLPVAMRETKEALENVSSSLELLQDGMGKLQASLTEERASLSNTLSDPACTNGAVSPTCNSIRSTLSQLDVGADFHRVIQSKPENEPNLLSVAVFTHCFSSLCLSASRC